MQPKTCNYLNTIMLLALILLPVNIYAVDTELNTPSLRSDRSFNTCDDIQINRQWENAVNNHKNDRLVTRLYSTRLSLCELLRDDKIDAQSARFTWDQAVISALVEKGKEATKANQGGELLQLFGNF